MSFDREERILRALRALPPVTVAPDARVVVVDRTFGDDAPGLLVDLLDHLAPLRPVGPSIGDEGFLVVAVGAECIAGYAVVNVEAPGRRAAIRSMHPEASGSAQPVLTLVLGGVHAHLLDMGIERLCVSARATGREQAEALRAAGFRVEIMTMSRDLAPELGAKTEWRRTTQRVVPLSAEMLAKASQARIASVFARLETLPLDGGDGVRYALIPTAPERSIEDTVALVDGLAGLWRDLLDADQSRGLAEPIDPEAGWRGARRRHLEVLLSDNPAFVIVALRDAQPVGYVLVDVRRAEPDSLVAPRVGETSQAVIVYLSVTSAERGNGIGTELMDLAERRLSSAGQRRVAVAVLVDSPAVGFYHQRGYGTEELMTATAV